MYQCEVENTKLINRINRISGQVNSLKRRLEDEVKEEHQVHYEIIRQLTAIKGAVNGMINSYIEHFAKGHLVREIRDAKDESQAMAQMDSLVDVMRSFGN